MRTLQRMQPMLDKLSSEIRYNPIEKSGKIPAQTANRIVLRKISLDGEQTYYLQRTSQKNNIINEYEIFRQYHRQI